MCSNVVIDINLEPIKVFYLIWSSRSAMVSIARCVPIAVALTLLAWPGLLVLTINYQLSQCFQMARPKKGERGPNLTTDWHRVFPIDTNEAFFGHLILLPIHDIESCCLGMTPIRLRW